MYYNPDHYGLEIAAQIDFSTGIYCFDYRIIWKELKPGRFFTARDSGCSCPSPFENYHKVEDLQVANFQELIEEARTEQKDCRRAKWYDGDNITEYVEKLRYLKRTYA
jgi:hypothetical protein